MSAYTVSFSGILWLVHGRLPSALNNLPFNLCFRLEGDAERAHQEKKLNRIMIAYEEMADEMSEFCGIEDRQQGSFRKDLYQSLSK